MPEAPPPEPGDRGVPEPGTPAPESGSPPPRPAGPGTPVPPPEPGDRGVPEPGDGGVPEPGPPVPEPGSPPPRPAGPGTPVPPPGGGGRPALTGLLAVAAAAGLWAGAAIVAKGLFDDGVTAVELAEARAVLATAGFALLPGAWRRPERPRPLLVAVLGVTIALVNVSYYGAIARIPVAVALVLQYTAPGLVVVWTGLATRRRPPPDVVRALVAATLGVVLVVELLSGGLGRIDGTGVVLGLASAVFFASYTVLAEAVGAAYGTAGTMRRAFAATALLWLVFQAPRGVPDALLTADALPAVVYVGLLGTLAPFFLFVWGIRRVQAQRAAIAATLEPVLAAVFAWVWLGEGLSAQQVAGGALVIAAVVSLQSRRRSVTP